MSKVETNHVTKNTNGTMANIQNTCNADVEVKAIVPDGGWGWVVCCSCLFGNITMGGIFMSYGILLPSLKENFHQGTVIISFIGSVMTGLAFLLGPLVAILTNRLGLRPVFMMGSILSGLALLASTFSFNAYILLLTYGVCGGLGLSLIMLPTNIGCNYYFDKKRALATGISKTGVTIGGFIFPPLIDLLLESFNWKVVVYVYSTIAFISCFFGALIRPLELKEVRKEGREIDENGVDTGQDYKNGGRRLTLGDIFTKEENEDACNIAADNFTSEPTSTIRRNSAFQQNSKLDQKSQRRSSLAQVHSFVEDNLQGPTELVFQPKTRRGSKIFLPALAKSNTFYDGSLNEKNDNPILASNGKQSLANENKPSMQRKYSVVNLVVFEKDSKRKNCFKKIIEFVDLTFWKNPAMLCLFLSRFFGNISMSTFYMYLPSILLEQDISLAQASIMLTVVNIVNTIFRVSFGALMDHPKINCLLLNSFTFVIGAVIVCIFPFFKSYSMLMVLGGINGAMLATYPVCLSIAIGQMVPTEKLPSVAGKLSFGMGIGSLIGPVLGGFIFDYSKNPMMLSFYNAAAYFLTAIFACASALLHRRSVKNDDH